MSHMQQMLIGGGYITPASHVHEGTLVTIGKDISSPTYGYASGSWGSYTSGSGYTLGAMYYSSLQAKTSIFFNNGDISGGAPISVTVNGSTKSMTYDSGLSRYIVSGDQWNLTGNYPSTVNWTVTVDL